MLRGCGWLAGGDGGGTARRGGACRHSHSHCCIRTTVPIHPHARCPTPQCNFRCWPDHICERGRCRRCPRGTRECANQCRPARWFSTVDNCGRCGNRCRANQQCRWHRYHGFQCVTVCPTAGDVPCNGQVRRLLPAKGPGRPRGAKPASPQARALASVLSPLHACPLLPPNQQCRAPAWFVNNDRNVSARQAGFAGGLGFKGQGTARLHASLATCLALAAPPPPAPPTPRPTQPPAPSRRARPLPTAVRPLRQQLLGRALAQALRGHVLRQLRPHLPPRQPPRARLQHRAWQRPLLQPHRPVRAARHRLHPDRLPGAASRRRQASAPPSERSPVLAGPRVWARQRAVGRQAGAARRAPLAPALLGVSVPRSSAVPAALLPAPLQACHRGWSQPWRHPGHHRRHPHRRLRAGPAVPVSAACAGLACQLRALPRDGCPSFPRTLLPSRPAPPRRAPPHRAA